MDNDDIDRGRILTRREAIALVGGGALAYLAGCGGGSGGPSVSPTPTPSRTSTSPTPGATPGATATPGASNSCIVRPELTEGPYFVDEKLLRSDIRSDPTTGAVQAGVPLALDFVVSQVSGGACSFLQGAALDIWHANASGQYSDIASEGTSGQKFLRGYQVTSASGVARFTTIFPGWYRGRAVHIHMKLRATIGGRAYEFTSQLFFDDALSTSIFAASPYSGRGTRDTFNANDGIYSQGGNNLLVALRGSSSAGYSGSFGFALSV